MPSIIVAALRPRVAPELSGDLLLGYIPGTDLPVVADFERMHRYHTAVLGVTGMGKTEFVFDCIRHAVAAEAVVVCVDFTGEYRPRLKDLRPRSIGLSTSSVTRLSELAEKVETGEYSAAKEKLEYSAYIASERPALIADVGQFLAGSANRLALFELADISNTRATLKATELLVSAIFEWAKNNRKARKILLVLEEAHTIVPEGHGFGFDKVETGAVLNRISQVALQGRKYGVGLLVVSQRTALVSKTILSQCGTYVCFGMVDKTSLDYMENVCAPGIASMIPRLRERTAVVTGSAVRNGRPVVVEIPFDSKKARASALLDKP